MFEKTSQILIISQGSLFHSVSILTKLICFVFCSPVIWPSVTVVRARHRVVRNSLGGDVSLAQVWLGQIWGETLHQSDPLILSLSDQTWYGGQLWWRWWRSRGIHNADGVTWQTSLDFSMLLFIFVNLPTLSSGAASFAWSQNFKPEERHRNKWLAKYAWWLVDNLN